jgi:hypothetical protein
MANGPDRAEFWKAFVLERSGYPAPERLRAQLARAEFSDFCDCGCNSFTVKATPGAEPLGPPGKGYGSIYEADFRLSDGRTLELILFGDEAGNLAAIDVSCCANSYPVPDIIDTEETPFATQASRSLLK